MTGHNVEMTDNKVVISGIAGRFPNSNNVGEFQDNLLNKVDCTTPDHGRWNIDSPKVPQRMGKCNNIEKFDRVFFGVHNKLTAVMDPVSRLLLEHCCEAIMDAGINPRSLKGARIAVFIATNLSESEKIVFRRKVQQDGFGIIGGSKAMIPNRISFFLGLTGPSVNMDSGCTGSASALEKAYHAIKDGHCDGALVSGSILCLHPHLSLQLRALGLLSVDGVTRCFDDNASGGTRSDGVTALFLQKASIAKRIYQEIVNVRTIHTACHDVNTIMYPKVEPQVKLMKELLDESGLTPNDISYLEASGIGIKDIDAEELEAIDTVYGKRKDPLCVGSVKSYVGDATPANTANSIIKVILASESGQISPNLHYEKPNSKAESLKEGRIYIPKELMPWTGQYSSVNTTSICGTFANILLKAYNKKKKNKGSPDDDLPRLVIASGRTEEAVAAILNYMEKRSVDAELLQMLYDIFETEFDGHLYRGYTIVPAKGLAEPDKQEILFNNASDRQVWWIFSGMGSQWVGMGKALLKLPVFNAAIKKCDSVLRPEGYDIYKIITTDDPKMFDNIINSFVGIAAIQIGLVDVLRAVNLEPDYIIGHSVGELGCAYADGCFTAEQMILAALSRGLASTETKLDRGSMAAVGLGYDDIKRLCPPDIDVACHNGPDSSTISGPAESMRTFVASLKAKGIFAKEVPCSNIAYHSRYIAPAGPNLLERLQHVIPTPVPRSAKWVSSSVPRGKWNTMMARLSSAEYHTNNLLSPVLFDETSRQIPANAICVEIAPHGLLQAILKRSLLESCVNVALTKRGHPDNLDVLLRALGKLYNAGLQPQISNLYPKIQYPVSTGTPFISPLIKWDHSQNWLVSFYKPHEEIKEGEKTFEIDLNEEDNKYLEGNIINGKIAIPLSLYLVNTWEILKKFTVEQLSGVIFEDIKIHKLLVTVPDNKIIKLIIMVPKGTGRFEIIVSETLVASGIIKASTSPNQERLGTYKVRHSVEDKYEISQDDFYTEMEMRGFQYSGEFQSVIKSSLDGSKALVKWNGNWVTFIDSALQLYAFGNDTRQTEIPLLIRKIIIDRELQESEIKNCKGVKIVVDKKVNYLSVCGLEIQGLKLATVAKNLEQAKLSADSVNIIPNIDTSNLPLVASVRLILQLVLENIFSTKLHKIQLLNYGDLQKIKMFNTLMYNIPEASLFKAEVIPYENATNDSALTILLDLKNYDLNEISKKIQNGKFLLAFIANDQEDMYIKLAESANIKVVLIRKYLSESIILFRKKFLFTYFTMLNVSKNIAETIYKVKNINVLPENERLVVTVKSKDNVNFIEFINQLEEAVNLERVRVFYIQEPNVLDNPIVEQLYKRQLELDLLMNVLTPEKEWATLRRTNATLKPRLCKSWIANQRYSHSPTNITWTEGPIAENNKIIKVEYSSLNPQDILIANGSFYAHSSEMLGLNRISQPSLGLEFSGINSVGNRVMGVTYGNSMSNFVNADAGWTWMVPNSWSLEEAVTVPFSYIIAYSSLLLKGQVEAGERVMLSNPCSGLGLAILHLAVQKKCDVFVTYETEDEKKLIQLISPDVRPNRLYKFSGNSFRDTVLLETKGQGVDIVICNQCKVSKLEMFLTMTRRAARVILISDLNDNKIHESIGMEIFLREISLYSVVPKQILLSDAETKKILRNMLQDGINTGCVKPLPRTIYCRDSINEAFDACISKKNLGKIVVKIQPEELNQTEALAIPRLYCSKSRSYLIIEGLTTFGMELIDWLIVRGARKLVVASKLKNDNGYINLRLNLYHSYGVKIVLHEDYDLSLRENIRTLFKEASSLGPVDAIFDLQRIDTTLRLSASSVDSVNSTTKTLDLESRIWCPELRAFVVCSAVTNAGSLTSIKKLRLLDSTVNSQDQTVIEILGRRKKDGLNGLMIRWGFIDSAREYGNIVDTNIILPPITRYLQKLDEILGAEESVIEVSYVVSPINKVEEDITNSEKTSRQFQTEVESFTAGLYEQFGVHVEGFSYLQV